MEVYRLAISQFAMGTKGEPSTMPRIKCYLSSHNHLSAEWVPSRLVSFKLGPMRIFHFHKDGTMGNSTPLFQIYSRISFYSNLSDLCQIFGCSIQFEVRCLFALFVHLCPLTTGYGTRTEPSLNH